MQRNVAGQKVTLFAYSASSGQPALLDAPNISAFVSIDDGDPTPLADGTATEINGSTAAGYYAYDVSAAETNGVKLLFTAKSTTSGVLVISVPAVIYTTPPSNFLEPANVTITWKDALNVAVPFVNFLVVGQGHAVGLSDGTYSLGLLNGTYSVVSTATNGILFPTTPLTVSGTTTLEIAGAAASIPVAPAGSSTCVGYVYDGKGQPSSGQVVSFEPKLPPSGTGVLVVAAAQTATSDGTGRIAVPLIRLWKYRVLVGGKRAGDIEVADADNTTIPNLILG